MIGDENRRCAEGRHGSAGFSPDQAFVRPQCLNYHQDFFVPLH
jgi:hypothetical protein